jgi:hypothetical protein
MQHQQILVPKWRAVDDAGMGRGDGKFSFAFNFNSSHLIHTVATSGAQSLILRRHTVHTGGCSAGAVLHRCPAPCAHDKLLYSGLPVPVAVSLFAGRRRSPSLRESLHAVPSHI